jgi:hypothetical protein
MSSRVLPCILFCVVCASVANAQSPPPLVEAMAGTWNVQQKMWTGPSVPPTELPPAIAQRHLVDGKYLEESMHPSALKPGQDGYFVRNAFLNYNAATKKYEYFSIDTRAPQAMNEQSAAAETPTTAKDLTLVGSTFTAPEWGKEKNVTFAYRLMVGVVRDGNQTVQLFLTPQSKLPKTEFVAFEYQYVRQP